ncbi:MAG TPA: four helix bundle protein [Kofleriaceae bacterium]|nr:four helix bundle protein [Kofleriaceae bacterium]
MLDYEKLDVYQCSIEHLTFVFKVVPKIPRGHSAVSDQWKRAAMSIPLNIAEAVGKKTAADRENRYAIARGEAMECGAILDVIRFLRIASDSDIADAKRCITRIVEMLSKMCR